MPALSRPAPAPTALLHVSTSLASSEAHVSGVVQYLPFRDGLFSLSTCLGSIRVAARVGTPFLRPAARPLLMPRVFIHVSAGGHGLLPSPGRCDDAAANMAVQVSL